MRAVVFVDYQNVYATARDVHAVRGQIDPVRLARLLVDRRPARELVEVRVYCGLPDGRRDPRTHAARTRQIDAWRRSPLVRVTTRPLRYPPGAGRPVEKGIDVALAIDFVVLAVRGAYDVGILVSTDTDLLPALEAVLRLGPSPRVEVASWSGRARLAVPGERLWCHWLDRADYAAVEDRTAYGRVDRAAAPTYPPPEP